MSSNLKYSLAVILLGLIIIKPFSTVQAAGVQDGLYFAKTNQFYKVGELEKLSITTLGTLFSSNKTTEIYMYFSGVGTASLAQANSTNLITAANKNGNKNNPEKVIPNGYYKDMSGKTITVSDANVEEFKVLSIE